MRFLMIMVLMCFVGPTGFAGEGENVDDIMIQEKEEENSDDISDELDEVEDEEENDEGDSVLDSEIESSLIEENLLGSTLIPPQVPKKESKKSGSFFTPNIFNSIVPPPKHHDLDGESKNKNIK